VKGGSVLQVVKQAVVPRVEADLLPAAHTQSRLGPIDQANRFT